MKYLNSFENGLNFFALWREPPRFRTKFKPACTVSLKSIQAIVRYHGHTQNKYFVSLSLSIKISLATLVLPISFENDTKIIVTHCKVSPLERKGRRWWRWLRGWWWPTWMLSSAAYGCQCRSTGGRTPTRSHRWYTSWTLENKRITG